MTFDLHNNDLCYCMSPVVFQPIVKDQRVCVILLFIFPWITKGVQLGPEHAEGMKKKNSNEQSHIKIFSCQKYDLQG